MGPRPFEEIRRAASNRPHYSVTAERDGVYWFLRVSGFPGIFSQVRRLDQADEWIRDAIALMQDVEPDSFDVTISPRFEGDLGDLVDQTLAIRKRSDELAEASSMFTALTVHRLVDAGLSLRDVGVMLGISFQRAQQLATAPAPQEWHAPALDDRSREILAEPLAEPEPAARR